ncbi:MAG: DnaD domain protein [Lachnospiraceae bacterium]|nr:DnaD domain protein [Lachnospiraceae bacterium]
MKTITISTENCETYSSISNFFIDYYMTEANGEFVKVYLYLVRLLNTNSNITVAGIADHFNLTENDICRAIKYWISRDVLKLNYDGKGHLKGIVLLPLHSPSLDLKMETDAVSILRLDAASDTRQVNYDNVAAATKEIATTAYAPANTEISPPAKPNYSSTDVEKAMKDSDFEDIIYLINTLFGRPVTQNQISSILYIYDTLHFSLDLFEYLIEYCVDRGKKNIRYMESVAIGWYKDGIRTRQQAKDQVYQTNSVAKTVFKALGIRSDRTITPAEIEIINTWTNDYGFSEELIGKACEVATLSKPTGATLNYVNGILEDWSRNNVKTLADVDAIRKAHSAKLTSEKSGTKSTGTISNFNDFRQSTSDKAIDDMERRLRKEVNG